MSYVDASGFSAVPGTATSLPQLSPDVPSPALSAVAGASLPASPSVVGAAAVALLAAALAAVSRAVAREPGTAAARPGAEATDSDPAPPTLDADEQFVVDLLRSNDSRLHQSVIVEESDWSKSKVSRLLSRMERDGHVEKVPVGRENVVVLVGED